MKNNIFSLEWWNILIESTSSYFDVPNAQSQEVSSSDADIDLAQVLGKESSLLAMFGGL